MTRSGKASVGLFLIAGAAIPSACNDVLGIRAYPSSDASTPFDGSMSRPLDGDTASETGPESACGIATSGAACTTCLERECCAEATACKANEGCGVYEDCLVPCGSDYACRAQCAVDHIGKVPEIPTLDRCIAANCAEECGVECAMPESFAEPDAAESCETCLGANACQAAAGCGTSVGCLDLQQCGIHCASFDCIWACLADNADAGAPFVAYSAALETCRTECTLGAYWDCNNGPAPALSETGTTKLTLNLVQYPAGGPVVGATVKACSVSDRDCAAPVVAPGETDAHGNVTFDLAAAGLFPFSGYFDISSASTYPTLLFLQAPLTVPEVTFPNQLVPSVASVQNIYAAAGVTAASSAGTIQIQTTDCHWLPAANVFALLDADGGSPAAFIYPDSNGGVSSTSGTAPSAFAVALNVPTGAPLTIVTTPAAVGRPTAAVQMFTRPGTLSFMNVYPVDVHAAGQQ